MSDLRSWVEDAVAQRLCTGCGVCAYLAPEAVRMVDVPSDGRRPSVTPTAGLELEPLRSACPGLGQTQDPEAADPAALRDLADTWGPVLGVWEGHATDAEVRRQASSGGVLTALARFALEELELGGVLHTAADPDRPYLNRTVLTRDPEQLLSRTGSRYAPASPCDGLEQLEQGSAPGVFIGKPCDVAGARGAADLRPALADKLDLVLSFFCAGTPSTEGTFELLRRMGIDDPQAVQELRYRGAGWPGRATARAGGATHCMSYSESWGEVLQKFRPWRCHMCADHTGEQADIAVGDPWYRPVRPGEAGSNLIVARTPRGLDVLRAAIAAGAVTATRVDPDLLARSQPGLALNRGRLWGRLITSRLLGVPVPRYRGFPTFPAWMRLSLADRLRSFAGTARRILVRGLRHPLPVRTSANPQSSNVPSASARQAGVDRPGYVELNRLQPDEGLSPFTLRRYAHAAQYIPADAQVVLDVGCNTGLGAASLRAAAPQARLLGVECVPERARLARAHHDEVFEELASALPLLAHSVDAIVALELIEHLEAPDVRAFLDEARRVLRPGGRLILTTPNPEYLRLAITGRSVLDDPAHLTEFRSGELVQLLDRSGLQTRQLDGTGRVSAFLGQRLPWLALYGSYLLVAEAEGDLLAVAREDPDLALSTAP